MIARVPAYCDAFVQAFEAGHCGDHLHLGLWDESVAPAASQSRDFEAAQKRLTDRLLMLLEVGPHSRILDVACGLGGTLREADARYDNVVLTGLNIDPKQIAVCRRLHPHADNDLNWIVGDACTLPFADACFDAALCVEAMFHFASRAKFLAEVSRVLKPGGMLAFSDILLQRPTQATTIDARSLQNVLAHDYAPWPQPWFGKQDMMQAAGAAGLHCEAWVDASAAVAPSYDTIAPIRVAAQHGPLRGPEAMRRLQDAGFLSYVFGRLIKPTHDRT